MRTLVGRVLPLCRDAVGVLYSPSLLGSCRYDPKYLTRGTEQVFISLIRFISQSLLLGGFLRYSFIFFSFSSLFVWWCPLPIFQNTSNFSFIQPFKYFPDLAILLLQLFLLFYFKLSAWHIFKCQTPFIYPDRILFSFYVNLSH